jgi:hypothetical protein
MDWKYSCNEENKKCIQNFSREFVEINPFEKLRWLWDDTNIYVSRRGSSWPRSRVMPFIPTKYVACMSTLWLLGNVYTAKSCKGKKRDPDSLKLGLVG